MFAIIQIIIIAGGLYFFWKIKDGIDLPDINFSFNSAKNNSTNVSGNNNTVDISYIDNSQSTTISTNVTNKVSNSSSTSEEDSLLYLFLGGILLVILVFLLGLYLKFEIYYGLKKWIFTIAIIITIMNISIFFVKTRTISVKYTVMNALLLWMIWSCVFRVFDFIDYKPLQQALIDYATTGNSINPFELITAEQNRLPFIYLLMNVTVTYVLLFIAGNETISIAKGKSMFYGSDSFDYLLLVLVFFILGSGLYIPIISWLKELITDAFNAIERFLKKFHAKQVEVD